MAKFSKGGYEIEVNVSSDSVILRRPGSPAEIEIPRRTLQDLVKAEPIWPDLGPTLQEWFDAGYRPHGYPPLGYNAKPYTPELMEKLKAEWEVKEAARR